MRLTERGSLFLDRNDGLPVGDEALADGDDPGLVGQTRHEHALRRRFGDRDGHEADPVGVVDDLDPDRAVVGQREQRR